MALSEGMAGTATAMLGLCSGCRRSRGEPGPKTPRSSETEPSWGPGRREAAVQKGWSPGQVQRCPTHRGPACCPFCRTDLAKLLIFYKDLNQRSIMESPANTVSSSLPGPVLGL